MKNKKLKRVITVGSRPSQLAQGQVKEVLARLRKKGIPLSFDCQIFSTKGDQDKATSLLSGAADDFFTDTLDRAVLNHSIDIAIHSAKDLPQKLANGLKIFALTESIDDSDALVGRTAHTQWPNGSRIGTSSPLRKTQILAVNPTFEIVDIRGTIQERLQLIDHGAVDGVIVATCALKRLGLTKRISRILPWEGTPLQGQLAVVGRESDDQLREIFAPIDVRRSYGKVFLVGAGPGDPELITVKAVEALKAADCVFYDFLVHKDLLDYAPRAEKIDAGKRKGCSIMTQEALSQALKNKAMAGQNVVRLKGGDPLIFGRGADEIAYLRSYHIDVQIIPGVTSATGIPSSLALPLTARGISSSVAFLSAHGENHRKSDRQSIVIPEAQTLVFLMGLSRVDAIVAALLHKGWPGNTPAAVISKGTCFDQAVILSSLDTLSRDVAKKKVSPPALIVIGKTVSLFLPPASELRNILYLGTYPEKYKTVGRVIHFPMIEIRAAKVRKPKEVLAQLKNADTILLTSRCGVKYFFEFLAAQKFNFALLRLKDFVVIGVDTERQLRKYGFTPQLTAKKESSVGLFQEMKKTLKLKNRRIIFPRSALANPYLKQKLTQAGSHVREVIVYENVKPEKREWPSSDIAGAIFTSPSTVHHFLEDYQTIPAGWKIYCKGAPTRKALSLAGFKSEILVRE